MTDVGDAVVPRFRGERRETRDGGYEPSSVIESDGFDRARAVVGGRGLAVGPHFQYVADAAGDGLTFIEYDDAPGPLPRGS